MAKKKQSLADRCLNWPPSRGKNPHTHDWRWAVKSTRRDLPKPKPCPIVKIEKIKKAVLKDLAEVPKMFKVKWKRFKRRKERKKPVLTGTWKFDYHVESVASLTVEQADRMIHACSYEKQKDRRRHGHHDNWWRFAPRDLTVRIDYPLSRGVLFTVKPAMRKSAPCKACKPYRIRQKKLKRVEMSPGYFLWMVAKEYERIYKQHRKYGIWGHAMNDLYFEGMKVKRNGTVDLWIGS